MGCYAPSLWLNAGVQPTQVAERIADQWLQPGGMAEADFRATYRWLYSRSEYFDPGLL